MGRFEVLVIGAGAAGLVAASRAAARGCSVLLVEKTAKGGVKVLMSGGPRCNLTQATDAAGIAAAFGREQGSFLRSALARLDPEGVVAMFRAAGVATKVEPGGKVFPASDSAVDVQRALLAILAASGAELRLKTPVTNVERRGDDFVATTPAGEIAAERVVLTVGGQSYPGCGTTGDGYAWAKAFGHRIVPPRPALVPLLSPAAWVAELQGVAIADAVVTMRSASDLPPAPRSRGRRQTERGAQGVRGALLFTHFGLSGPAPMNASGIVTAQPHAGGWSASCDFAPDVTAESLAAALAAAAQDLGKRTATSWLADLLPRRLAEALASHAGVSGERRLAELSKADRAALVAAIKSTAVPIAGTQGFKKAEVTAGGVDLREVDSRTMASKLCPGLFFAGEILDLDGPIGGYNFQAAFSTGALAGDAA